VRIQKRYWFGLLAMVLIGVLVFLTLPPAEPLVNGRPLSYWLDQYWLCYFQRENVEESSKKIDAALSAMDDRCIQVLIEELNWKPSRLAAKLNRWAGRWVHLRIEFDDQADRRAMAALVLGRLGTRATNAIPALDALRHEDANRASESWISPGGAAIAALVLIGHDSVETCARKSLELSNPDSKYYQEAINCLGTNAAPSVPIFVSAIESPIDDNSKHYAASALGTIRSRPELSLAPLMSMLKEKNEASRYVGAIGLMQFGSSAKPAWNDLVMSLGDPNEKVRIWVTNAMCKIDPEAAKQMGMRMLVPID
jgi:hypothetical protein